MSKGLMIYGSCVSRDAFELLRGDYALLDYIARQSLISALSKPTELLDEAKLSSKFQNRSLHGDLKSNLLQTVRKNASAIVVLLIDLTDERLGVLQLPDGTYVTRSHELQASGRMEAVKGKTRFISFGTPRHFQLWAGAATRAFNHIESLGLKNRTLVLNTPWAENTDTGEMVPPFRSTPTAEMNEKFLPYYQHLRSLGYRVADMPQEHAYSTSDHKWGAAPYHFGSAGLEWIASEVRMSA